ncbi:MAG: HNH endonuclease [Myxococcales bacterium]|nr:HNH endonuclease [Myxococcales bacterium]
MLAEETCAHLPVRERALRDQKIAEARQKCKSVACEVCGFDFAKIYGIDYAEVHHLKPLASTARQVRTKLSDLAILCANCHRVVHLGRNKVLSIAEIKKRIQSASMA